MARDMMEQLHLFNQNNKELDGIYSNWAKTSGLSDTAFWLLYSVWEQTEAITQKEICETWSYSRQTVNSALKILEKDKLIKLEPLPANRKTKQIFLTEKGTELAEKVLLPLQEAEQAAFAKLSSTEREGLLSLLQKFNSELRREIDKIK